MKRFLLILFIIPLISFVEVPNNKYFEISKNLEIFTNLYKQLNIDYVDELDPGGLMRICIDAMLVSLDPYTNYISESQIESYRFQTEGKFDGLGAQTKLIDDFVTITDIYDVSPAKTAGLKVGDQIISIDGNDTEGMSTEEVRKLMQGADGTSFNVMVKRLGEQKDLPFTVQRSQVKVTNVPYSGFVSDDIGYVILTTFTQNASKNIGKAIKELKDENPNLKGLVFDLRNNGGGLLMEAINVSNLFIPKGEEVVTTKGKVKERSRTYKTLGNPLDLDIPLTVLTNKSSASASEIVAGVLQDYDRGVIIGQRSYGKGLVQITKDIGYNSKLKITTSKYYIPSGRCIQSVEYADGEPKDIPDSTRTSFKTRNGRPVLDGGGITPDLGMNHPEMPEILKQIKNENLIFKYINQWTLDNPTISEHQDFTFNDYDKFLAFLIKQGFEYKSVAQTKQESLLTHLQEKEYGDELINEVTALFQKIKESDDKAVEISKAEIIKDIEMEIVKRYYEEKEKILFTLKNDVEVQKAIQVISNSSEYQKLLN